MNEFIKVLTVWNQKQASASQELKQYPEKSQEINASMQREYTNFQSARQTFIAQNQNSPALLVALSTTNPENEFTVYESLVNQLVKSFSESPTIKEVNKNFIALKEQKEAANFLAEGKMAPDFSDTKLDGKTLKLSDLKGQVVLLDFWASWCGPCRKENPNVVKMYEKYYKDGFTVMSVSFDQDREKWKKAIEADHLIWPNHVSDLKGWSSATGKIYQITSIPFTVLIDQEGKIIKTNLRGEALEQELLRIFGH
jgi:peroxiredoxin